MGARKLGRKREGKDEDSLRTIVYIVWIVELPKIRFRIDQIII